MYKLNREGSERILSDLRLKNSYIEGTIEKTGNIFVDKPWVVNYNDNAQVIDLHDTLYNNYQKYAINHLDEPAIFDPTKDALYTHRQVLDLIDKAMHGFKAMGIGENSKVGIVINGHIEEPIIFMALNALGATQKYIDFMKSVPAMIHSANEADLDLLVLEEMFLPLEGAINGKGLPIVVTNNAQEYTDDKHIDFAKLTTMGQDLEVSPVAYEEGKPTIIISSSGTTGDPKPIVHSDYKVNAAAQKMLYTDYPLESGNVMLKMMPAQLGLGLVTSLYTSLASGCVVTMIGGVEAEDLVKQMVGFTMNFEEFKKKANLKDDAKLLLFTAPIFMRALVECPAVQDLSCMGALLAAGSKMGKEELEKLDEIARQKGCQVPICNGYGQNEMCGAIGLNVNAHNCRGSAGFPTIGTNLRIVDPETFKVLGVNERGLILEDSDSEFLGYHNMEEATKRSQITLEDGFTGFNSNDLGHIDENGFIHITGRTTRVAVRFDFKFSLDDIEAKIRALPFIQDVGLIVSDSGSSFEGIAAFVKPVSPEIDVKSMIEEAKVLSDFEMPSEFIMVEELPYRNGKIMYKDLEKTYKAHADKPKVLQRGI